MAVSDDPPVWQQVIGGILLAFVMGTLAFWLTVKLGILR